MKIKNLKNGDWFTLKPISKPKENQVFIRLDYDKSEKKYMIGRFDDISYSRLIDGNKEVFTDFEF